MLGLEDTQKPPFNEVEIRILGCLMEKQLTTPKNYPLTMNALALACNQKTNREPIMQLKEGDIGHTVRALIEFGWTLIQNSGRAQRVEHKATQKLKLDQTQQAVLAILLLRGPQTLNEIKTRTERMANFDGSGAVTDILHTWMEQEKPMVVCLPASGGQREDRYYHILGVESPEDLQFTVTTQPPAMKSQSPKPDYPQLLERIDALEERLNVLEDLLK